MVNDSSVVNASHIVVSYRQGRREVQALSDVSVEVRAGEMVAVRGPSGSGKSTLLQVVGLLARPTSGSIRLLGNSCEDFADARRSVLRRKTIGFVFQSFNLLPHLSALANVMVASEKPAKSREKAAQLLETVGLSKRGDHLPRELSIGEQQRVALARALVNGPRLLLADEPTGSLDSDNEARLMDLFVRESASGMGILLVTHSDRVSDRCHRSIVLADGRFQDKVVEV